MAQPARVSASEREDMRKRGALRITAGWRWLLPGSRMSPSAMAYRDTHACPAVPGPGLFAGNRPALLRVVQDVIIPQTSPSFAPDAHLAEPRLSLGLRVLVYQNRHIKT